MTQALSSAIELGINQALGISVNGFELVAPLAGKRCVLHLQELELTLGFQFSDSRVDVLNLEKPSEQALQELPDNECFVSVSLFALPELKHTSQLTKLIRQNKLDFYGDLAIVQKFSQLFAGIEFDIEESLSTYLGDAGAYTFVSQAKAFQAHAQKQFSAFMQMVSDAALEEKPIAVRPVMVANFVDEVRRLNTDTERLEARINLLVSAKEDK
ncbi:ubiquinone biosynthesis accessory factor UbiJ [Glaciecola siphonariae]